MKDCTIADWVAEGETTMALLCVALGCGHHAIMKPPNRPLKLEPIR
ncbi:hypothetical protein [Methylorubrum extorquens]